MKKMFVFFSLLLIAQSVFAIDPKMQKAIEKYNEKAVEKLVKTGIAAADDTLAVAAQSAVKAFFEPKKKNFQKAKSIVEILLNSVVNSNDAIEYSIGVDEIFDLLIEKYDASDSATNDIVLRNSLQTRNIHCLEKMSEKGVNPNLATVDETPALIFAVENGCDDIAKLLLEHGANANERSEKGATALMLASYGGYSDIVKMLLNSGADVNAKHENGLTALIGASIEGHSDIVKLLLESGVKNIDAKIKGTGWSALMFAVSDGHSDIVEMLLKHGANVNAKDEKGFTALVTASIEGHSDIVKMLLEYGANPNIKVLTGYTPLMHAAANSRFDIVKMLVEHGADVNAEDDDGKSVFGYVKSSEIADYLEAHGAERPVLSFFIPILTYSKFKKIKEREKNGQLPKYAVPQICQTYNNSLDFANRFARGKPFVISGTVSKVYSGDVKAPFGDTKEAYVVELSCPNFSGQVAVIYPTNITAAKLEDLKKLKNGSPFSALVDTYNYEGTFRPQILFYAVVYDKNGSSRTEL